MADKEIRLFDPNGPVYREMTHEEMQKAMEEYQFGLQRFTLVQGLTLAHIPTAFMDWWNEHRQQVVDLLIWLRRTGPLSIDKSDELDRVLLKLREIHPELFPPDPEPIIVTDDPRQLKDSLSKEELKKTEDWIKETLDSRFNRKDK